MAEVLEVTDQNFEEVVLKSETPAIIDFWAEWCAPCRAIAPIIKDLAGRYGDQVKIVKMNIDENPSTPGTLRRARDPDGARASKGGTSSSSRSPARGRRRPSRTMAKKLQASYPDPGRALRAGSGVLARRRGLARRQRRRPRPRRRCACARGGVKKRTGQWRRTAMR